jgi:hypothetical protein
MLIGRTEETAKLDILLDHARGGMSGALVRAYPHAPSSEVWGNTHLGPFRGQPRGRRCLTVAHWN